MRGIDLPPRKERDDLDALLHPAQAFDHPQDVVRDPDLSLNEKRAILASWASDACAVEAAPVLRRPPGAKAPVRFEDVMEALRSLDREAQAHQPSGRRLHRRFRDRSGWTDEGSHGPWI